MYYAYVTTIKELQKHSNADRLMCATIFGNNVIVDTSYHEGQKVVYFPVDGQLSEEFANDNNLVRKKDENGKECGGYLDPVKRNIKAINLRGEKSDGLILPIEVLGKYTDVSTLADGEQISTIGGHEICKKYVPKPSGNPYSNASKAKKAADKKNGIKVEYPFFKQHVDTEQLAYNKQAFKKGDTCYITLKMHGSSGRTANTVKVTNKKMPKLLRKLFKIKDKVSTEYSIITGTRRVTLDGIDERTTDGYYGNVGFRKKWHDFFSERLPKGMEVYYELVGWVNDSTTIMPRCKNSKVKDKEFSKVYGDETVFSYGCEQGECDCYVYRMTMTNPDGVVVEIPTEEVAIWCEKMGVKFVPVLEKFQFSTWNNLMKRVDKYMDIVDPIGKTHIAEGVVVRIDNRSKFTAFKNKSFYFKILEGIIKDEADAPDMEEAQEFIDG